MGSTAKTEVKAFSIKKGPDREKLLKHFEKEFDKGTDTKISFFVEDESRTIETVELSDIEVIGINHVDNSGQLFNMRGYCYWRFNEVGSFKWCDFEASYNTNTSQGVITLYTLTD